MKRLKIGFGCRNCDASRHIDVVIPTISKDFEILSLVVQSLRFVEQRVNKIYIVAPKDAHIEKFCIDNNLTFVDEICVLGFDKNYIHYCVDGKDRSGWLFQQLLKLSGDRFVEMDDYLVVDSDTVYVNRNCFVSKGKYVRVFGDLGAAEWVQENPEILLLADNSGGKYTLDRTSKEVEVACQPRYQRFKAGHPAGFIEAFANYYFDLAEALTHRRGADGVTPGDYIFGVEESLEGLRMLEAIERSSRSRQWEKVN